VANGLHVNVIHSKIHPLTTTSVTGIHATSCTGLV